VPWTVTRACPRRRAASAGCGLGAGGWRAHRG
jgi:hypothetical protein